jgi:hypothetical protein
VISNIGCCGRGVGIAFVLETSEDILIERNTFFDTGLRAIEADGVTHSVFRDNVFFDTGSPILDEGAFIELSGAHDVLVENNYFRDDLERIDHGILVRGGSELVIRRNIVVDLDNTAIHVDGSEGTTIAQNTLVAFDSRDRTSALLAAVNEPTGLVATGNVLMTADEGPLVSLGGVPGISDWIDRNAYWKTGTGAWFELGDSSLGDLAAWTKATGADAQSLATDPMLGAWERAHPSWFAPQKGSPILDTYPGPTEVTVAGSGTIVHVAHSSMFSDGKGLTAPDTILVGQTEAQVVAVDPAAETVTVDASVSFEVGDPVTFPSAGKGPDYGAVEAGIETEIGTAAGGSVAFD